MKTLNHHLTHIAIGRFYTAISTILLITSAAALNAEDSGPDQAGIRHPLARSTRAEVWPSRSSSGVPAGLIWRSHRRGRGVILCLHGIQTHAPWFGPLAQNLRRQGWTVIAPDRRGSGANTNLPYRKGHTKGAKELLDDLDAQMKLTREEAGGKPVLLLGTSWGSNLAGAWLNSSSEPLPDGFIQLVPATRSQFDPNPVDRLLVASLNLVAKAKTTKVPFDPELYLPPGLTPSPAIRSWKILETDSPICKGGNGTLLVEPTFGTLQAGLNLNHRVRRLYVNGLPVPTLVIQATGDQIMKNNESWEAISASDRESGLATRVLLNGGHGLQLDDPNGVTDAILKWWESTRK